MKRTKLVNILERLAHERPDVVDATALIASRRVLVAGVPVASARTLVQRHASLTVDEPRELAGTRKLRAALARFGVPVADRVCVDVGASTGGFTVALLDAGARRVYAVDAGHGQLLGRLRLDARVVNLERTNLGALDGKIAEPIDAATVDVSYLSLARAAPQLARLPLADGAHLVALVKPMFELSLDHAPLDDAALDDALARAAAGVAAAGFAVVDTMRSPVAGGRGARELFLHARAIAL
jgi:23S rRNA (cytidine1920-2'-O)/16S rRNA (cytidine1409-2'-O)-methyltransferase